LVGGLTAYMNDSVTIVCITANVVQINIRHHASLVRRSADVAAALHDNYHALAQQTAIYHRKTLKYCLVN